MEFKRYKKGSHTYTRYGKGVEVRDDRIKPVQTDFLPDADEVYANAFGFKTDSKGFHLLFGRNLPPAPPDKLLDPLTVKLTWRTAVQLKKDLEAALAKEPPC